MLRLLFLSWLAATPASAQIAQDAAELLQRAQSSAGRVRNWRAEILEQSQLSGAGMNLKGEVLTRIAVEAPLRMSRKNSGDDQTMIICDGTATFYSGDGHSYYRGEAKVTPQCDFPLSKFYELENNPFATAIIGRDHVRLAEGDRPCLLIRAAWKREAVTTVRILCIDPVSALIIRDMAESNDETTGIRIIKTTTFTDFEVNPTLPQDTFKFPVLPDSRESKAPI